ncbi:hypothetical protein ACKVMT_00765 [Halobacteriales archaeon Cl-PHB]
MAMAYELRFTTSDQPRHLELFLCTGCMWRLCGDPDVQLVDAATGLSGPDVARPE